MERRRGRRHGEKAGEAPEQSGATRSCTTGMFSERSASSDYLSRTMECSDANRRIGREHRLT